MLLTTDDDLRRVLAQPRSVGVLGAKPEPWEPAFSVPRYLHAHGWAVIGVNPRLAGSDWLGRTAVASLDQLPPVDVVEIFRRAEALPAHVEEILALPWRPNVVWFQLGIRHDAAATRLVASGIDVVQDRCMMPEHRRLVGP